MKFVANTADAGAETLIADHRGFGRAILPFVTKAAQAAAQARAIFGAVSRGIKDATVNLGGSSFRWRNTIVWRCRWPEVRSKGAAQSAVAILLWYDLRLLSDRLPSFPRLTYESLEFTYAAPLRDDDPKPARVPLVVTKFAFALYLSSAFVSLLTWNERDKNVTSHECERENRILMPSIIACVRKCGLFCVAKCQRGSCFISAEVTVERFPKSVKHMTCACAFQMYKEPKVAAECYIILSLSLRFDIIEFL